MHKDSSDEAQEIVHEINSSIYEYLDGHLEEQSLKARLAPHVQRYRVVAAMLSQTISAFFKFSG